MVIINNRAHGMVRQFQQTYFKEQYQSTVHGYDPPDFVRVAEAYGVPSSHVRYDAEVQQGLEFLWADPTKPALIEVAVDLMTNVYPKVAFGRPLTEMEPDAQPTLMEST
jgi:acetolactate synthase-1/2/3 large subunit